MYIGRFRMYITLYTKTANVHTKTANVHTKAVHVTVEAFLGGRDKKTRETPRGERVATKKKTCGAPRAPQIVFFWGPAPLFLFVSRAPRERSFGLYIGLPCLSGFAVSLLVCRFSPDPE